ncbi:iron-sulfur cluster assembly protein [Escherichia coli]|uniref:Iron-sulfur cluster assembly protein n=1 Tax=Escherichia coli TaxID=562 RepID=A0A2X3LUZ1_ECOLX|nr:iron-sulfur cluster assembly protein [Escherichia coli]
MSITLSDSAAARVNTFLANRGKGFWPASGRENLRMFRYGLCTGIC